MDYISKNLYTFFDIQLYSKIWVGSERQEFEMIFDTGSSWVWVQTDLCHKCMANDHKFSFRKSKTFRQESNKITELRYGKGAVFGYSATD